MHEFILVANAAVVGLCQVLAMIVIVIGIIKGLIIYIKDALLGAKSKDAIQESRAELGHAFSLGLGFLVGGTILNSTVAPTWNDIGQLGAIIAIRTILNYTLMKEIEKGEKTDSA